MKMDISLSAKQSIAPNLIHSLELTKMTSQELSNFLNAQAMDNPIIDMDLLSSAPFAGQVAESIDWLNSFKSPPQGKNRDSDENLSDEESGSVKEPLTATLSLKEFLSFQLSTTAFSKTEKCITEYLINCIDKYGYLSEDPVLVAKHLGVSADDVEKCISALRSLSPAGVCSPDLKSCLLAQIDCVYIPDHLIPAVKAIIENHLKDLAYGHFSSISKKLRMPLPDIRAAGEIISKLQPYPSAGFDSNTFNFFIFPDASIEVTDGNVNISLMAKFSPYLNINSYYTELYSSTTDQETKDYLSQKFKDAYSLFESVSMREKNMFDCISRIAERQIDFFSNRNGVLLPMTLSDIAEDLGLSISTVSRTLSGKNIQCCHGILPAKSLFSRKISTNSCTNCSSDAIKSMIKSIIDSEDKGNPLSDARITAICNHKGAVISRRAVAKYRSELQIPSATLRKQN